VKRLTSANDKRAKFWCGSAEGSGSNPIADADGNILVCIGTAIAAGSSFLVGDEANLNPRCRRISP